MNSLKQFLRDHRDLMFKYIVKEISRGLENNAKRVNLFQFGETNLIAGCYRTEWSLVLEQALEFFKSKEMYEDAAICRDLLRKIYHETDVQAVEKFLENIDKKQ
jgi:hypothetical protein